MSIKSNVDEVEERAREAVATLADFARRVDGQTTGELIACRSAFLEIEREAELLRAEAGLAESKLGAEMDLGDELAAALKRAESFIASTCAGCVCGGAVDGQGHAGNCPITNAITKHMRARHRTDVNHEASTRLGRFER